MSIIKKACFELNFLNLKSFPSNLFFVVASSLSILCKKDRNLANVIFVSTSFHKRVS